MIGTITITPGELYYLGTIMKAKYIDYVYVASMEDINKNYSLYELQTRTSLINAGILAEDFSGELTLDEDARSLLLPIFFGEFESCIDITAVGDEPSILTSRFHVLDTTITMVRSTSEGKLQIERVTTDDLVKIVSLLLPVGYSATSETAEDIPQDAVTRIFAVKNTHIGKDAIVQMFVEANGIVYREEGYDIISLDTQMFKDLVLNIIKENGHCE